MCETVKYRYSPMLRIAHPGEKYAHNSRRAVQAKVFKSSHCQNFLLSEQKKAILHWGQGATPMCRIITFMHTKIRGSKSSIPLALYTTESEVQGAHIFLEASSGV